MNIIYNINLIFYIDINILMSMELEQELVDFFINNTQYDKKFIYDLFNILKNHLGESVKSH